MELDITPLRCPQFYGVNVARSLMHRSASFLIHLELKNIFSILVHFAFCRYDTNCICFFN